MRIGIIGSGNIGATLGRLWTGAGHEVLYSYSRDDARLTALADAAGPMGSSGSPADAAGFGPVVVLSVPWPRVPDALSAAGDGLQGRILVDTCNPYGSPGGPLALDPAVSTAAAWIADRAPGSRVVKAFNTLYYVTLAEQSRRDGERLALPVSGDDESARTVVAGLVRDAGYDPVELGGLGEAWRQEPEGPLYSQELELTRAAMLELLGS